MCGGIRNRLRKFFVHAGRDALLKSRGHIPVLTSGSRERVTSLLPDSRQFTRSVRQIVQDSAEAASTARTTVSSSQPARPMTAARVGWCASASPSMDAFRRDASSAVRGHRRWIAPRLIWCNARPFPRFFQHVAGATNGRSRSAAPAAAIGTISFSAKREFASAAPARMSYFVHSVRSVSRTTN